jgi:hypothetical protein
VILGLSVSTFTAVHVAVSLIAIASGVLALLGTLRTDATAGLAAVFLFTSAVASATGFLFPSARVGMGHAIGVVSLVVLVPTVLALYRHRLAGRWRWIYLGGATTVLYLNAFIAVWQAFGKIAVLHRLAPTPSAPPFLAAHLVVLAVAVALAALAARRLPAAAARPGEPAAMDLVYPASRPRSWSRAMHDEHVSAAILQSTTAHGE